MSRKAMSDYVRDAAELEELSVLVGWAFGSKQADSLKWLEGAGREHVRVLHGSGRVQAGLLEIPMGQWFGGRRASMLGVAGVAVAPEARGQGLARRLLTDTLRAAHQRKVALSTLYPATLTLYRSVGYELSGSRYRFTARTSDLPREKSPLELEPFQADDASAVEAMYGSIAAELPGSLDRCKYIWDRVRAPGGEPARCMLAMGERGPEGYVYLKHQRSASDGSHDLLVSDLVAVTPRAARRLLALLGEHRSTAGSVTWHAGPAGAMLFAFPERVFGVALADYWMLRIVHVERALLERGYAPVDAELDLQVEDSVLPENSGRYLLRVEAGRASVERSEGTGRLKLDVSALAPLYSGFATPEQLERAGRLEADAFHLGQLSIVFSGGAPGLGDFF